ncbi:MAG TPA: hypothetical protein VL359_00260 [bacterium]|nr:hypothetical protein [bacterium]
MARVHADALLRRCLAIGIVQAIGLLLMLWIVGTGGDPFLLE